MGSLGLFFAGYVPLASQNPYPILVNFWSIISGLQVIFGKVAKKSKLTLW